MSLSPRYRQGDRARPVGDVIRKLLRSKRFHQKGKYGALVDAWAEVVGEAVAARTRIRSFHQGQLLVEVESSVLFHELGSFLKEDILRELRRHPGSRDVAELRLCLSSQRTDGQSGTEPTADR
ncbi:MAG: DciA family protein [Planctomycetota bacterium]|jgi:hypothetical protein